MRADRIRRAVLYGGSRRSWHGPGQPQLERSAMRGRVIKSIIALLLAVIPSSAWADGAIAVGCDAQKNLVWGYEFGRSSVEEAQQIALQRCQAKGSDCALMRSALHGDGAWIALADDPSVPPSQCLPFGAGYSAVQQQAEQTALANCRKNGGGPQCKVSFVKQNAGVTTYHIVPGTGGGDARPYCLEGQANIGTLSAGVCKLR